MGFMTWLRLRVPPLALAALAGVLIWGIAWILPSFTVEIPLRLWIAAALALLGGGVALSAVVSFRRAKTTVDPIHPEATTRLLVYGVYHHSRNPMYLGMLLGLGGWSVYHANVLSAVALLCFVGYVNRFQIQPEEEMLSRKFGAEYEAYSSRVRRWL
jgi:protein-S-isoprenylcysteine O-methyltransferase Ste14